MPRIKIASTEIAKYLMLLEDTPDRIAVCTNGLDSASLTIPSEGKGWSVVETLAHLRACAELWTHSIYAMLAENDPTLPLHDERRWAKITRYASLEFDKSLQSFGLARDELLGVLRDLPETWWGRAATIEGRTHTVFSQSRRMALHEVEHCEQIEAMLRG